jgi:hypothetical protein
MKARYTTLLLLLAGCYQLNLDNGQLRCSVPEKKCPKAFHCADDGYCWKMNENPPPLDMGVVGKDMSPVSVDMTGVSGDMSPVSAVGDMAQLPPSPSNGGVVLSGGTSASSKHYKVVMSTGQTPGGNQNSASASYKLKSGLPAITQ